MLGEIKFDLGKGAGGKKFSRSRFWRHLFECGRIDLIKSVTHSPIHFNLFL